MTLYEGMFLLDNQVVRADWPKAKALVCDTVTKHGGEISTARRWDERKLCYPIDGKKRATYVLSYYTMEKEGIADMRRDFELSEDVLRYMMVRVEEIPEGEAAKSAAENDEGFSFPRPPEDDEPEETPAAEAKPDAKPDAKAGGKPEAKAEAKAEDKPEAKAEDKAEAKAEDAPAAPDDTTEKKEEA